MSASFDIIAMEILHGWLSTIINLAKILIPLMIIIELLTVYHVMEKLADKLQFLAKAMGMEKKCIFPLLVGITMGVTYGAGTLIEMNKETPVSNRDYALIGIFLFLCHSIIEATLLFWVVGANILIISVFRLLFAFVVTMIAARLPFFRNQSTE